jgi:hypothetical protein
MENELEKKGLEKEKNKYIFMGVIIGIFVFAGIVLIFSLTKQGKGTITAEDIPPDIWDGIIEHGIVGDLSNTNLIKLNVKGNEINISTYAVANNELTNIDSITTSYYSTISENKDKYGFNITIPKSNSLATSLTTNLDEIVFKLKSDKGFQLSGRWFRTKTGIEKDKFVQINEYVYYNFDDILSNFKYQKTELTEDKGLVTYEESIPYKIEITKDTALVKFDFSKIKFEEGEVIELDPTTIYEGEISYLGTKENVLQEPSYIHLNISTEYPYNNLIVYYPFDVNESNIISDYSQNSLNLTRGINTFYNLSSPYLGSIRLNKTTGLTSGGYLNVENNMTFQTQLKDELTVSTWAYVIMDDTSYPSIFSFVYNNTERIMLATGNQGALVFFVKYINGSKDNLYDNNCIANFSNKWIHYAVSINTTGIQMYANGERCGNANYAYDKSFGAMLKNSSLRIGADNYYGVIKGNIDEFMMFNVSLNQSTIQQIFNNQSSRFVQEGNLTYYSASIGSKNENRANVTIENYQSLIGTNVSFRIGSSPYVNFSSDGTIKNYIFTDNPLSTNLEFLLLGGTNNFYSPIIGGNISVTTWIDAGGDTCTCPGVGNNWEIDMSDNCVLSTPCNLGGGNLTFTGSGSFQCASQLNLTSMERPATNQRMIANSTCDVNL